MKTRRPTPPGGAGPEQAGEDRAAGPAPRLFVVPVPGSPDGGALLKAPGPEGPEGTGSRAEENGAERTEGLPAARATVLSAAVASDLRDRWSRIQIRFPDDPRGCVQDADGLIEEISTALAAGIGEHRSRLAAAWQDGRPEVEELGKSLQDYRAFISTLL